MPVLAAAALVLLTGCGGSETQPRSADEAVPDVGEAPLDGVDPCALVTAGEAEQALGGPIVEQERPVESNIESRLATCRYVAEQGASVGVLVVMVRGSIEPGEASIAFRSEREAPVASESVSGIGEAAMWSQELGLTVLSGERMITISGDVTFAQARTLAEQALERLD